MRDSIRALRASWWFLVGLSIAWLLLVPRGALAQETCVGGVCTVPASGAPTPARWKGSRQHGTTNAVTPNYYEGPTAESVGTPMCQYRASTLSPPQTGTFTSFNANYLRADCTFSSWGFPNTGGGMGQYCPAPSTQVSGSSPNIVCSGNVYTCPAGQGWTLSGSVCSRPACPSGTARNPDGTCSIVCPPDQIENVDHVCVPRCEAGAAAWSDPRSYGGTGSLPATFCNAGCQLSSDGLFSGYGSGKWWAYGVAKQTGVMCGTGGPASDDRRAGK